MILTTSLILALAPQGPWTGPGTSAAPVVINEFVYDNYPGTDDTEYVELYNRSNAAVDISGWLVEGADDATVPDNNPDYLIPSGTILAPGQHYVLGSTLVPNVDQVVGTTNLWENDNEAIVLRDANNVIIDSVSYEVNKSPTWLTFAEGQGIWTNDWMQRGHETSWQRLVDGWDTDDNARDFRKMPWTPGTTNDAPAIRSYIDTYETKLVGDVLPEFGGTFKQAHVVDPTMVGPDIGDGPLNPFAIPASPQGGQCAVFWDESFGGNTNMLTALPSVRDDRRVLRLLRRDARSRRHQGDLVPRHPGRLGRVLLRARRPQHQPRGRRRQRQHRHLLDVPGHRHRGDALPRRPQRRRLGADRADDADHPRQHPAGRRADRRLAAPAARATPTARSPRASAAPTASRTASSSRCRCRRRRAASTSATRRTVPWCVRSRSTCCTSRRAPPAFLHVIGQKAPVSTGGPTSRDCRACSVAD